MLVSEVFCDEKVFLVANLNEVYGLFLLMFSYA